VSAVRPSAKGRVPAPGAGGRGEPAQPKIAADALARRLAGLEPIGLSGAGTTRLAWTEEDAAAGAWFDAQAAGLGLRSVRDPAGSRWALPPGDGPWWAVGSHLDSVREGGRFDGALGVAAGFEIARACSRPLAVIAFADEEGARFNTPTFGSRALAGRLAIDEVLTRADEHGTTVREAIAAAGVDPGGIGEAPAWRAKLRGFAELHIDQSRDLARAGAAAGVVSALAARMRLRLDFHGAADHAGTTPVAERRDALAAAARAIVAAQELAAARGVVCTASRMLVEPNAFTTIPSHVRLWLDGRAGETAAVDGWRDAVADACDALAQQTRVGIDQALASRSEGARFDVGVNAAVARAAGRAGVPLPEVVCFAGHDAGWVALDRPAAMVLVRNASGISHAPGEHVSLDDAAQAASLLAGALEELAA
jgi:beta-ureidopropionase / N-carbamoyl-L-amino-acid hydrolase